ncbi:MAG: CBS domain-containing protein [Candidatus Aenigmarchaeota archaeon]|nr:CBS domain-containing protein [Candidatus Aenigmarchaeota archaeon]
MSTRYLINPENRIALITNSNVMYGLENTTMHSIVQAIPGAQRRLPVLTEKGNLAGILTYTDLIKALLGGRAPHSRLESFMTREVVSCGHDSSVYAVMNILRNSGVGGVPVLRGRKLFGLVNERDFLNVLALKPNTSTVEEIMTRKPFYINSSLPILDCIKSMAGTKYRRFPVVENKKLVGIVTSYDVLTHLRKVNFNIAELSDPVRAVAKPAITLSKGDDAAEAIRIMKENSIGGIPVVEDGRLEGIVTEYDFIRKVSV